jgi:hypothetical protein
MKSLMMKSFLLAINALLLFPGCLAVKIVSLKKTGEKIISQNEIASFSAAGETLLYKASIDIASHHYSGILLLKNMDNSSHIVMITELGIKLFDLEINKDTSRLIYVFEPINRPRVTRMIMEDMKLIFQNNFEGQNATSYLNKRNGEIVYKIKANEKNYLCYMEKKTNRTNRVKRYGMFSKINEVKFLKYENKIPQYISLVHTGIKIKIELTRLNNSANEE